MNDEIKEMLDRLERIDHKEYSGGFEFADSGSFDEDCRCFEERKKMADYITNLQQENERLKETIKPCMLNFQECYVVKDYKSRCEKASKYIDKQKKKMYKSRNKIALFVLMKLESILQNGSDE